MSYLPAWPASPIPVHPGLGSIARWKGGLMVTAFTPILLLALSIGCTSAHERALTEARARVGGNPERGAFLIQRYGCGGCHRIPGVAGAGGKAAPSLEHLTGEAYISGNLANTPENVMRWIESPHSILPNTKMPELGIGHAEARDITTYLWTLR